MVRIEGKPYAKIDTGLDSHMHNYHMAEARKKERERVLAERKKDPLRYPSKNETIRD